jgi:hypothetical protein
MIWSDSTKKQKHQWMIMIDYDYDYYDDKEDAED